MSAEISLMSCSLQMRRKVGSLDSGKDKLNSITFDGISNEASAATLLGVSDAVGALFDTSEPIVNTYRNDKSLVFNAGE